ncbi:MAG: hypothetical protein U0838_12660 [Chloroflexota bacterium]
MAARDLVGLSWQTVMIGSGVVAIPLAIALAVTDLADGRAQQPHLAVTGKRSSLLAIPLLVLAVAIGCYVACEVGVSSWLVRLPMAPRPPRRRPSACTGRTCSGAPRRQPRRGSVRPPPARHCVVAALRRGPGRRGRRPVAVGVDRLVHGRGLPGRDRSS